MSDHSCLSTLLRVRVPTWALAALAAALGAGAACGAELGLPLESAETLRAAGVTLHGAPEFVPGKVGRALHLAPGDYVTLPTAGVFDPTQGSLSFWVRPDWRGDDGRRHTFLHLGEADRHLTVFATEGGTLRFVYRGVPEQHAAVDLPIRGWKAGDWHQVTATWLPVGGGTALVLKVDDRTGFTLTARAFATAPATLFLGARGGPGAEPAEAVLDEVLLTGRLLLQPPIPVGQKPPVRARVDTARAEGPMRRIHDFTTLWNSRQNPLPFRQGDATFRRFREAGFSMARLIAFSDTWLWGIHVDRGADGKVTLDFADFDRLVDLARAAGAETYLRLAYNMPRALSAAPEGRDWAYAPPRDPKEWDDLMRRIVTHCVERKLGIRYFVTSLNEGDLTAVKGSSDWDTVCRLYERTTRIVKETDPTAKVGGPALAHDPMSTGEPYLRSFLRFCRERKLPLDFVCFHAYRRPLPAEYEAVAQHVRRVVEEEYPGLKPEVFLDEFNLWHQDSTQENEYAAGYLAAALHYQRRGGVDKSCIISFNHFLPTDEPRRVVLSHRGPFDKSEGQSARFLARDLEAGGVSKPGILAHPPAQREQYTFGAYEVDVPDSGRPRLTFSTGLAIPPHPGMDGATFAVVAVTPAGVRELFREHRPGAAWRAREVSLDAYRGQRIRLELRTHCGRNSMADWGAWGEPRVVAGDAAAPRVVLDLAAAVGRAETGVLTPGYRFVYNAEAVARYGGLPLIKGPVVTTPYFVYQMHSRLRRDRLALTMEGREGITPDGCAGILPSADDAGMAVLAWTFDLGTGEPRAFTVDLTNLARRYPRAARFRVRQYLIDSTHTNPWHDYVEAGKPDNGGRYNLEDGALAVVRDEVVRPDAAGALSLAFSLEPKAVTLFEVTPEP